MIYAEITYTGEVDKDNERTFYLQFHGKDVATNEKIIWDDYLTNTFESTQGGIMHDIYFS